MLDGEEGYGRINREGERRLCIPRWQFDASLKFFPYFCIKQEDAHGGRLRRGAWHLPS